MFPIVLIDCFIYSLLKILNQLSIFAHNIVPDPLPIIPVIWCLRFLRELHMSLHIEKAVDRPIEESHPSFDIFIWHN
jgi:hypothetical protein